MRQFTDIYHNLLIEIDNLEDSILSSIDSIDDTDTRHYMIKAVLDDINVFRSTAGNIVYKAAEAYYDRLAHGNDETKDN